jgi:hypothetical protein
MSQLLYGFITSFGLRRHDAALAHRSFAAETAGAPVSMLVKSLSTISSGFRNFARNAGSHLNASAGSRVSVASSDSLSRLGTNSAEAFIVSRPIG